MKDYKIFLDMDGVLADFDKAVNAIIDKNSPEFSKGKLWHAITNYNYKVQPFFENLPVMKDAPLLIEFLEQNFNDIEILTAAGFTPPDVEVQKIKWGANNFPKYKVNVVKKSVDKAKFARNNTILIDDRNQSIVPFMHGGGIGVLHTSALETIDILKNIFKNK